MTVSLRLFISEIKRLYTYKILTISLAISALWMVILYGIGEANAQSFVGLFIALDASVMSILMLGASLFFEREENTLKPLLVTPVSTGQIIGVKVASSIYVALQSAVLVSLFVRLVMGIPVDFMSLILLVILIALVHSMIGFYLAMKATDFSGLLVNMIIYSFTFAMPSLMVTLGLISGWAEEIVWLSPIGDGLFYMQVVFQTNGADAIDPVFFILSIIYLLFISTVLYVGYIKPNYATAAVKE